MFDVGGYRGDFSAEINGKFGCECYCFEPVSEFYKGIERRFRSNDNIHVFGFGLSDHTSEDSMQLSRDGSSTVIDHGSRDIEEVHMVDIAQFLQDHDEIHDIALMKI